MTQSLLPWVRRPAGLGVLLGLLGWACGSSLPAGADTNPPGIGGSGLGDAETGALLAAYFQRLLDDRDLAAFHDRVAARYTEGALGRILAESPVAMARRAAVVALGQQGHFAQSNTVLGRALRDRDAVVRRLAEDALWSIWFRAGTPEQNRTLQEVAHLIGRGQISRAETLANHLVRVAPDFAEAYNQRAILYFQQGRFADSAADCQRVLSRNPYHFGALGGLAQCLLRLDHPADALKTLHRALRLQPFNQALRENVKLLEAEIASAGPR
ncbi:MAG TPA: tetratricopeptide repeat protein [Isosphaeraceae bacterium]|nr:tetratricopeptide repeat protein [Isosphaeraceae bacterium]